MSLSPAAVDTANRNGTHPVTRAAIIGCGGMARNHVRNILLDPRGTSLDVMCEPSTANYALMQEVFTEHGSSAPPNVPDLETMLTQWADELDAVFVVTPHSMHYDHVSLCLEAGVDVLVEKPMVVNQEQAKALIARRDATGQLLVVAFQGSLSPHIRWMADRLQDGTFGPIRAISGTVWQNWKRLGDNRWRSDPAIAGGGFMFDTGAHIMNTIADLAGEDFVEVAAWQDNAGTQVDIMTVVMARLASGPYVTIHACGDAMEPSCSSDILIFTEKARMRACMWGRYVEVQQRGDEELQPVDLPLMKTTWHRFLEVRHGIIPNPSPPEVGLRMLKLWDAIKASAAQGGRPVPC